LNWEAITEVMVKHWRQAGRNVDGGPGLPWSVSVFALVGLDERQDFQFNELIVGQAARLGFGQPEVLSSEPKWTKSS
jgi:hypothetical protein